MAQPGKIRFSIEATAGGTLIARAVDVPGPSVIASSLVELRAKLAEHVRLRFPAGTAVALLVGAQPSRRVGPKSAPRPDAAPEPAITESHLGVA